MGEDLTPEQMLKKGWDSVFNTSVTAPYERPIFRGTFRRYGIPMNFFDDGVSEEEAKKQPEFQKYNPRLAMRRWLAAGGNGKVGNVVSSYCKSMRRVIDTGHGLFLYWPNGTGKTGLTVIAAVAFLQANEPKFGKDFQIDIEVDLPDRFKVKYIKTSEILAQAERSRKFGDYYTEREELVNTGFLVIDDLSDKALETVDAALRQDFLDIIKTRLGNNLITIFTTNLKREEIVKMGANTWLDAVGEKCLRMEVADRIRRVSKTGNDRLPWE